MLQGLTCLGRSVPAFTWRNNVSAQHKTNYLHDKISLKGSYNVRIKSKDKPKNHPTKRQTGQNPLLQIEQ